jgi:hypothetical protein
VELQKFAASREKVNVLSAWKKFLFRSTTAGMRVEAAICQCISGHNYFLLCDFLFSGWKAPGSGRRHCQALARPWVRFFIPV